MPLTDEQVQARIAEVKRLRQDKDALRKVVREVVRQEMRRMHLDMHTTGAVCDDHDFAPAIKHFQPL